MHEETYEIRIKRYSLGDLKSIRGSIDLEIRPDKFRMVADRIAKETGLALILLFFALTKMSEAIVKEYESDYLRILGPKQQDAGRKLVL